MNKTTVKKVLFIAAVAAATTYLINRSPRAKQVIYG